MTNNAAQLYYTILATFRIFHHYLPIILPIGLFSYGMGLKMKAAGSRKEARCLINSGRKAGCPPFSGD
jgi:hypothetical protein